jgi:selenocysteine lyase/cysteine desulfurase
VRPSLALYNTYNEIDALAAAIRRIQSRTPHHLEDRRGKVWG